MELSNIRHKHISLGVSVAFHLLFRILTKSIDLDLFFGNFSPALVGSRPVFDSIDGGVLQTIEESFNYNGESVS